MRIGKIRANTCMLKRWRKTRNISKSKSSNFWLYYKCQRVCTHLYPSGCSNRTIDSTGQKYILNSNWTVSTSVCMSVCGYNETYVC